MGNPKARSVHVLCAYPGKRSRQGLNVALSCRYFDDNLRRPSDARLSFPVLDAFSNPSVRNAAQAPVHTLVTTFSGGRRIILCSMSSSRRCHPAVTALAVAGAGALAWNIIRLALEIFGPTIPYRLRHPITEALDSEEFSQFLSI